MNKTKNFVLSTSVILLLGILNSCEKMDTDPQINPIEAADSNSLGFEEKSAEVARFYVSTTGNNSNPGTIDRPFRTINKAYSLAVAGNLIYVRGGTYTEVFGQTWGMIGLNRSGYSGSPIRLKAYPGEKVILDAQNINDNEHKRCIRITGNYNVVDGFEITRAFLEGIVIYGSYNQILNCNVHNNGNYGVAGSTYGQDGIYSDQSSHDNLYAYNNIHHNGRSGPNQMDHGMYVCGDNEVIRNNIITNNTAWGIQVAGYSTVSNLSVYNNVIAYNRQGGMVLWQSISSSKIKNNIFYKNTYFGIRTSGASGSGNVIDRNTFYQNSSGALSISPSGMASVSNAFSLNPLFESESTYRLLSSSPAINVGTYVGIAYYGSAPDLGFEEKQ